MTSYVLTLIGSMDSAPLESGHIARVRQCLGATGDEDWLAENEEIAEQFLRASFRGWVFCRDNFDLSVRRYRGSSFGASWHLLFLHLYMQHHLSELPFRDGNSYSSYQADIV